MVSTKINKLLNEQMNVEFFSAYSYLSTAAYFDAEELFGFSGFFRRQAREELDHAMKIFDYLAKAGGRAALAPVAAPKAGFTSAQEAFEKSLEHERKVTASINRVMDAAMAESDHATRVLLNWFVTEQLEEETLFSTCLKRVKIAGTDGKGLLILDQEFAQRAARKESGAEA